MKYIRGKPNGKLIWKSIQNGPTPHPMITDPPPTDSAAVPAPREKLDSEFSEEENKLEMADYQVAYGIGISWTLQQKEGRSVVEYDLAFVQWNEFHSWSTLIYTHLIAYELMQKDSQKQWFPEAVSTNQQQSGLPPKLKDSDTVHDGHFVTESNSQRKASRDVVIQVLEARGDMLQLLRRKGHVARQLLKLKHSSLDGSMRYTPIDNKSLIWGLSVEKSGMHQEEHLDSDAET
ncbi:hypothetical protein Tco_0178199 [Tanacetum coccineum]